MWWVNPIVLALDKLSPKEALQVAGDLQESIGGVKVNDLLDFRGIAIVRELKEMGLMVMADPKIEDILRTMSR